MSSTPHRGRSVILACTAFLCLLVLSGQTTHRKIAGKAPKSKTAAARAKVVADSVAAARADSTQKVVLAKAGADSVQRKHMVDSLAQVRSDSLKKLHLRKIKNEAFGVGERLVFDVNYLNITAGEAVMAIPATDSIAGRKCFRVEFTVNSTPFFSSIYKVEDRYFTYIDVEAIVPWRFEQHIREGSYRRDFVADFDQIRHVAKTTEG